MAVSEKLARIEKICGHEFHDKLLLRRALTHPSAVEGEPVGSSYERLEFLGDSILGAIVADALYRSYPNLNEGRLTRLKVSLVSGAMLSEVGEELGIGRCIIFGASERGAAARGMHSALENVYESLVGALFLDGGWEAASAFITATLKPHLAADLAWRPENPKSYLQECVQRDGFTSPAYKLVGTEGPAHAPTLPPWQSWTACAVAGGAVPPRRRRRRRPRSTRSSAWATLKTGPSPPVAQNRGVPCTSSRSPSRASSRLPTAPI